MTFVDFAYFRMLFFRLTDSDATKDNRMLLVREIPMFSIEHLNGCIKTFSLNELLGRTFREGVSVFGRNSPVRVIHSTNKQLFSRLFRYLVIWWLVSRSFIESHMFRRRTHPELKPAANDEEMNIHVWRWYTLHSKKVIAYKMEMKFWNSERQQYLTGPLPLCPSTIYHTNGSSRIHQKSSTAC